MRLYSHTEISASSVTYVMVRGDKSPYDGDDIYWSSRLGRHPLLPERKIKLLKQQKGKCSWCGLHFRQEDVMEVDHKIPLSLKGKDQWLNLQLLHQHCHDEKTRYDLKQLHQHQQLILAETFSQINWKWIDDVLVVI